MDFSFVTSKLGCVEFGSRGGHLTLRNTGVNTVAISWEKDKPPSTNIACGTSFECDQEVRVIYFKTQTGRSVLTYNWVPWS